jgi:hypothetical protein
MGRACSTNGEKRNAYRILVRKPEGKKPLRRPWRWRLHVPPKRRLAFNKLHGVMSQKVELFIATAVRTSNPTNYKPSYLCTYEIFLTSVR